MSYPPSNPWALSEYLRRVDYKPDYRLSLNTDLGRLVVRTTLEAQDSRDPRLRRLIRHDRPIHEGILYEPQEKWPRYLFEHVIMGVERHEAAEWFRVDGEMLFDPHREDP